jgi:hypothetical protein
MDIQGEDLIKLPLMIALPDAIATLKFGVHALGCSENPDRKIRHWLGAAH